MITQAVSALLNQQVSHELHNELQYKIYAAYFESSGLKTLSEFFETQAKGEHEHFTKVFEYVRARRATIANVSPAPQSLDTETICSLYVFTERQTTEKLSAIMAQAKKDNDEMTQAWLQDLLIEQIEEEDLAEKFESAYEECSNDWSQLNVVWKY